MASFETLRALAEHPEWIAPRSDRRVFLGEPGAPEATKTTVEPGNSFSPGMRSCGITWWLRFPVQETFVAPEQMALEELQWSYEAGYLPLLHCKLHVHEVQIQHSLFQDGTMHDQSEAVCGQIQITNTASQVQHVQLFLVLRSLGTTGGPLPDLTVGPDGQSFWLAERQLPLLGVDQKPGAIGCGVGDPSTLAQAGQVPPEQAIKDSAGWCFGLLRFDLNLQAHESWSVRLDAPIQTQGTLQNELPATALLRPDQYERRARTHLSYWREQLGTIELDVPDRTFHDAFFAGLQHMLTAVVGDQARIAPLSYPLPWLRDSIYIMRCFDLAGRHDLARAASEYCARNDFFGGFGAEGDAPGQGIWALVQHYRIIHDKTWLARIYPALQRKCEWLFRMRRTDQPLQVVTDTPVLSFAQAERAAGIICLAAQDGIIMGAMDHGVRYALGWINHWALCGLQEAAYAAQELGYEPDQARYEAERATLRTALKTFIQNNPDYFTWERTQISPFWPTRAWEDETELIAPGFDNWWEQHRGSAEDFRPEPYWLYFEFATAHNALLLGQRARAWQVLNYRLHNQDLPGLYGWREGANGVGMENAVQGCSLIPLLRGCQHFESATPHGWSQAECWLLQRAMLLEEWQGNLLLFAGVPASWLLPGNHIAFRNFPSWYGKVSAELYIEQDQARISIAGLPEAFRVHIRLQGYQEGIFQEKNITLQRTPSTS